MGLVPEYFNYSVTFYSKRLLFYHFSTLFIIHHRKNTRGSNKNKIPTKEFYY